MCVNKLESSSVLVKMHPEEFIWGMDRGLFEQVPSTFFLKKILLGVNYLFLSILFKLSLSKS